MAQTCTLGTLGKDTVLVVIDNPWGEVLAVLAHRGDAPADVWASEAVPEWFRRPL